MIMMDEVKLQQILRTTIKEELKIAWEDHSKDFQEFVVDHIQRLYDGQVRLETSIGGIKLDMGDMKADLNYVKADIELVKADIDIVKIDVSKLRNEMKEVKTDVKRIDIRIKTRKKYD